MNDATMGRMDVRWRLVGTDRERAAKVPEALVRNAQTGAVDALRELHGYVADLVGYYGHQIELLDFQTRPTE